MSKNGKRRKPRLDEKRVRGIAATFENEVGSEMFEIAGVRLDPGDANEWVVVINLVSPEWISFDGLDSIIMVNDQTGKARYYSEYERERKNALREK